jgi:hypothetical protein
MRVTKAMHLSEKLLYHQIHPAKLGTDIVSAFVSLYFFWRHELFLALIVHIAPPVIASFVLIHFADLEAQKRSAFGRYIKRSMTHLVEGIRLCGDIVMVFGAWYHSWWIMLVGLAVVVPAWSRGLIQETLQPRP